MRREDLLAPEIVLLREYLSSGNRAEDAEEVLDICEEVHADEEGIEQVAVPAHMDVL